MLYFFLKLEKMAQDLSSAAVMIGALRVNTWGISLPDVMSCDKKCLNFFKQNNAQYFI